MTKTVGDRVKAIIMEHLDVREAADEASLIDDLGADSLDGIELVMAMEEEFGIEIDDDEAESLITVGDIVEHVSSKV